MNVAALLTVLIVVVLQVGEAVGLEAPAKKSAAPWAGHLDAVNDALARGDLSAAVQALREAQAAALAGRRWDGLMAVGDVALRVGQAPPARGVARPLARQAYLAALLRARADGSLEGVLRATEAFAVLGDREVVTQGLSVARPMAVRRGDARALERLRALEAQLSDAERGLTAGDIRVE